MRIDEAIKILNSIAHGSVVFTDTERRKSAKLGIEALRFFKGAQLAAGGYYYLRLSGETEEVK